MPNWNSPAPKSRSGWVAGDCYTLSSGLNHLIEEKTISYQLYD